MQQLKEALVYTIFGTYFCQVFGEDILNILDQNDDSLLVYNNVLQLA